MASISRNTTIPNERFVTKLIDKSKSLNMDGLSKGLFNKHSSNNKQSNKSPGGVSQCDSVHVHALSNLKENQRGYCRQLAYYPRNESGVPQARPRVANYTKMDHCGGRGMAYEFERLKTFKNWPNEKSFIKPEDLAKAGFFHDLSYDSHNDRTKCAFCRGVLHSWEKGDEPIKEHRRAFSTCPFILSMDVGNIPNKSNDQQVQPDNYAVSCEEDQQQLKTLNFTHANSLQGGVTFMRCNMEYMTSKARRDSFPKWVTDNIALRFVRNGFYFTDNTTNAKYDIKCYKCHFESSTCNSDPIKDHEEQLPRCPFLEKLAENRPYLSNKSTNDSPKVIMSSTSPKLLDSEVLTRMDSWVVRKTIELGFDPDLVKYVVLQHQYFNGEQLLSIRGLIDCLQDLEEQMQAHLSPSDLSCKRRAIEAWKDYREAFQKKQKEEVQQRNGELSDRISKDPNFLVQYFDDVTVKERILLFPLKNREYHEFINEKLKSEQYCKICMDKPVNVICIPCNHITACLECTNNISECAVCRSPIENTIEVNLD